MIQVDKFDTQSDGDPGDGIGHGSARARLLMTIASIVLRLYNYIDKLFRLLATSMNNNI